MRNRLGFVAAAFTTLTLVSLLVPARAQATSMPALDVRPLSSYSAERISSNGGVTYTVTDLGALGGGNFCSAVISQDGFATAINASGEVVGGSCASAFPYHVLHGFLYSAGSMRDLSPGSLTTSLANAINGTGQIVGTLGDVFSEGHQSAFMYSAGVLSDLVPGAPNSAAYGINDAGQVVGEMQTDPIDIQKVHAFLDSDGAISDLGTFGGPSSSARAVNNAGQVVGFAATVANLRHAFLYSGGVMRDLGTLGGAQSAAFGINGSGDVVGASNTSGGLSRAFLYHDGAMTELGALGGDFSTAVSINDAGDIVGLASIPAGCCHAVLVRAGTMVDLNSLIPTGSGWTLNEARAINGAGQIAGVGFFAGERRPFLLTPVTDTTPPLIALSVSPAPNAMGWNNTDVTVTWSVTDPESGVATTSGCDATTVASETAGLMLTCVATNGAGLSASANVVIMIDKTAPVVTFGGNSVTYTVDQTVLITCSARDALSGIATSDCSGLSGPAYSLDLGPHSLSASATDVAGNSTTVSTTFTVVVTYASLCSLSRLFEANPAIANSLCAQLSAAESAAGRNDSKARAGDLAAYTHLVLAQADKSLSDSEVAILVRLAAAL